MMIMIIKLEFEIHYEIAMWLKTLQIKSRNAFFKFNLDASKADLELFISISNG